MKNKSKLSLFLAGALAVAMGTKVFDKKDKDIENKNTTTQQDEKSSNDFDKLSVSIDDKDSVRKACKILIGILMIGEDIRPEHYKNGVFQAFWDSAGECWTISYGLPEIKVNGKWRAVKKGDRLNDEQALKMMTDWVYEKRLSKIGEYYPYELKWNRFCALCSFSFNTSPKTFKKLCNDLLAVQTGKHRDVIAKKAQVFDRAISAGGGLILRRWLESALWNGTVNTSDILDMRVGAIYTDQVKETDLYNKNKFILTRKAVNKVRKAKHGNRGTVRQEYQKSKYGRKLLKGLKNNNKQAMLKNGRDAVQSQTKGTFDATNLFISDTENA